MNDFLIAQLAREHMSRLTRQAELTRLVMAAESSGEPTMRRRRRREHTDHR
jgi:hypothetical protein